MPKQKDLKKLVRARMSKTGESYTAARLRLITKNEPAVDYASLAGMSDASIQKGSGRSWEQWVRVLDAERAADKPHREIAAYVSSLGVGSWWSQSVTVGYERIRGLRERMQKRGGGYEATKSRTLAAPVEVLYDAVADARKRRRWLKETVTFRSSTVNKRVSLRWSDDTPVLFNFLPKSNGKCVVSVTHQKLSDRSSVEAMKKLWAGALERLGEFIQP